MENETKQCSIKINDHPDKYAVTEAPTVFKQPKYKCEKHGEIGNNIVKFTLPNWKERNFCLYCYQEMVAKYCREAQEQALYTAQEQE